MSDIQDVVVTEKVLKMKSMDDFYEIAQRDFNFMIPTYWLKVLLKKQLQIDIVKRALHLAFR